MPKRTRIRRDLDGIRKMKDEAHDLIDAIVRTGWSRNRVYWELADRLGVSEEFAHFHNLFTERDVKRALTAVQALHQERMQEMARRRAERRKKRLEAIQAQTDEEKRQKAQEKADSTAKPPSKNILPLAEQKRLLALKAEGKLEVSVPKGERDRSELRKAIEHATRKPWWKRVGELFRFRIRKP